MSEYISKINKNNTDYSLRDDGAVRSVNGNTPDNAGNVAVNRVLLADNLYAEDGVSTIGSFVLRTTAGASSVESITAMLEKVEGNSSWAGHHESFILSVVEGSFSVSVDNDTWRSAHSTSESEGTYTYAHDGTTWSVTFGGTTTTADLSADGLTISGEAASGDSFTIAWQKLTYGDIIIPKPKGLYSTGFNIFDKASMVLSGYTIDTNGDITAQSGSYVAFAPIDATKSTTTNYIAYNANGGLVRAGFCSTAPTSSTTGIDISIASGTSTSIEMTQGWTSADNVGYICVATTDVETLCIHPKWSGTKDTTYEPYTISRVLIPTKDSSDNDLPTGLYGIPAIGSVKDVLDFKNKTYTKKLAYVDNTPENIAIAEATGLEYYISSTKILYQLPSPVVYTLVYGVSGGYPVNDYGEEWFGAAGEFVDLPLSATIVYGRNLKDKLRNLADIQTVGTGLSLSNGTLSSSGGGPTVVQSTGTSTTDVMSQNAVTNMVFENSNMAKIRIGDNSQTSDLGGIAIGKNSRSSGWASNAIGSGSKANGFYQMAIGPFAQENGASLQGAIALGAYSQATYAGEMNIGSTSTSYGYNSSNYRLLTGLYDGQNAHDAATVAQALGDTETYTITTSDWTALASSAPYTYSATVTATHTIGNDTIVELYNDNPVLFATNGFAVGSVSGQSVTIYSIGIPSASVTLKVNYKG